MDFKNTTQKLSLYDETEELGIAFDEVNYEGEEFMEVCIDNNDSSVYLTPTQVKDVVDKMNKWLQNNARNQFDNKSQLELSFLK